MKPTVLARDNVSEVPPNTTSPRLVTINGKRSAQVIDIKCHNLRVYRSVKVTNLDLIQIIQVRPYSYQQCCSFRNY